MNRADLEGPHFVYLALSSVGVTIAKDCGVPLSRFAKSKYITASIDIKRLDLSLPARLVARGIYTTDRTNRLSEVRLRPYHFTLGDLVQMGSFPHVVPASSTQVILDHLSTTAPDDSTLAQSPSVIWTWDLYSPQEHGTEAEFFESQVAEMLAFGRIEYLPLFARERLTTSDAAEILDVNSSRVRQMLIRGQLIGEKNGRDWAIAPWDLIPVVRRARGRPATRSD